MKIKLEKQADETVDVYGVNGREASVPATFESEKAAREWLLAHDSSRIHDQRTLTDQVSGVYQIEAIRKEQEG